MAEMKLGNVMIDCRDGEKLRDFYAELTGWKKVTAFDTPGILSSNGIRFMFMSEEDFVPCVWPEEPGKQQKQMHLDFQVPDIAAAVKKAESLGARKAEQQFGGEWWTTMLDPDGHPFCLCNEDNDE